jgi:hypothetical protein
MINPIARDLERQPFLESPRQWDLKAKLGCFLVSQITMVLPGTLTGIIVSVSSLTFLASSLAYEAYSKGLAMNEVYAVWRQTVFGNNILMFLNAPIFAVCEVVALVAAIQKREGCNLWYRLVPEPFSSYFLS